MTPDRNATNPALSEASNTTGHIEEQVAVEDVLAGRASFYRMLSSIYYLELKQEQIDSIAEQDFSAFTSGDPLFDEGMADIRRYLKRRNSSTRQEMAVDYARNILGMGARSKDDRTAMPYESLFTSESRLLMQDSRDEVFRAFKKSRLKLADGVDVPEDHLSFMFEYLAIMSDRAIEALKDDSLEEAHVNLSIQQTYMEEHLLNWIDDFCRALLASASTPFYRGVAKVTQAFVHSDADTVEEMLACIDAAAEGIGAIPRGHEA